MCIAEYRKGYCGNNSTQGSHGSNCTPCHRMSICVCALCTTFTAIVPGSLKTRVVPRTAIPAVI
ncbi:hypothetical protein C8R44DRAFT_785211 [Mycena epipterygia]|nr:hypothetical protein C8R44DRAFT_785211 [Mycena epipterygia]